MGLFYCPACIWHYNKSSASFAQIAKYKARVGQYDEETNRDRIEFPTLGECISDARFQHVGNAANDQIEDKQFRQTHPEWLDGFANGEDSKQPLIEER
jgi:hypothetical protein